MMELENKFLVLKWDDIEAALIESERKALRLLVARIENYRMGHGKSDNRYVVINQDEPYFPDVLRLMEAQEKEQA